jgi:hypothetical protein
MNKQIMKNTGDYQNIMNKNNTKFALIFVLTVFLTACGGQKSLVFVMDFSESVSAEARAESFEAIQSQAKTLGRGDSITVIPVTSDALIETGGKVLRLEASEIRKLRDKDLREFQAEIEKRLAAMSSNATYKQTDLLGAMRVAQEEKVNLSVRKRRVFVIILSDLVHSTAQIRFETDAAFANADNSRRYAEKSGKKGEWNETDIYLGWLESSDLRKMNAPRREAVREFWQEYFKIGNAKRIRFATDGAGQLDNFIKAAQNSEVE